MLHGSDLARAYLRLREALEFYAYSDHICDCPTILADGGARARAALAAK